MSPLTVSVDHIVARTFTMALMSGMSQGFSLSELLQIEDYHRRTPRNTIRVAIPHVASPHVWGTCTDTYWRGVGYTVQCRRGLDRLVCELAALKPSQHALGLQSCEACIQADEMKRSRS